jgi:hypothetical protein
MTEGFGTLEVNASPRPQLAAVSSFIQTQPHYICFP